MTKQNKERLKTLYLVHSVENWPSVPSHARPVPNWTDSTTNGLTKCVIDFIQLNGYQAERISNSGRYVDNSKIVEDVLGFKRKIGTGKFIPGTGTNGTADISSTIHGRSVKIEIKFGADRQSPAQLKYQKTVESAGGIYWIVKTFDDFILKYDSLLVNLAL